MARRSRSLWPIWVVVSDQDWSREWVVRLGAQDFRQPPITAVASDFAHADGLLLIVSSRCLLLNSCNAENETELSFFNRQEYEEFLKDPKTEW